MLTRCLGPLTFSDFALQSRICLGELRRVVLDFLEQPGILHGDSRLVCEARGEGEVVLAKEIAAFPIHLEGPQDAPSHLHGHAEQGCKPCFPERCPYIGEEPRIGCHICHDQWLTTSRHVPAQGLPKWNMGPCNRSKRAWRCRYAYKGIPIEEPQAGFTLKDQCCSLHNRLEHGREI